ncbi:MAG: acetate kinase [Helicobacteraceae bacterium]|jgi:acetate kinase|nr:acetate kinase [Helicobacteraceae bacterium]
MKVLVLNAGSSSLKWKLFEMEDKTLIASGLIEGILEKSALLHINYHDKDIDTQQTIHDHNEAFDMLFEALKTEHIIDFAHDLDAIGHRVVHGGEKFFRPTLIDNDVLTELKLLSPLAPLHNPANILGIEITSTMAPHIPNIAVFDTAFHHTMPQHAYLYALPRALYEEQHIRRYGFHGTSHHFVALAAAESCNTPLEEMNLITLHLGNGASACAIKNGQSVDTSMGFTPLEGLIMGTRSGDLDPAIITYLMETKNATAKEMDTMLNKESGLRGICQENDLRAIIKRADDGDEQAKLALEMFAYRIKKYIGAYVAVLGRVDAIVFTGGIGEHADVVRKMVLDGLGESFGIIMDKTKNRGNISGPFHHVKSRVKLFVIPTDEELAIAQACEDMLLTAKKHNLILQ